MNAAPPGWNPDPTGRHEYRYWDGASWTDDVSDGGVTAIDALGGAAPGGDEPTAPFDATAAEPTPPSEPTAPFEPTPPSEPTAPFEPTAPYDTGPPGGFGAGPGQAPGGYGAAPGQGYGGYGGPPGAPGAPDAYGGAPPPPSAPGRSGPPVGLLVGLGVLALIVVVVLAVVLSRDDGDDTATDDVTTTTAATDDTEPETTTTAAPETTVAGPQDADVFSLAVGDCLVEETPDGEVQSLPVVPCEQPHASEIYYLHIIEGDSLPGPDEMESIARDECLPQFETFVGVPYEESVLLVTWLEPTQASWDSGDRELLCIAVDPEGDATGSFAGTAR